LEKPLPILPPLIEFQKALIQNQTLIASEQIKNASLVSRNQELEQEIVRLKNWSAEKDLYERRQIAPGVFAQVEKNFVGEAESAHKLCCNCFDKATPSTLQQNLVIDPKAGGRMTKLVCPNGCPPIVFRHYL
jgi:hypothetical protein